MLGPIGHTDNHDTGLVLSLQVAEIVLINTDRLYVSWLTDEYKKVETNPYLF